MANTLNSLQSGGEIISGIEDWSPPQQPKRVCGCGTVISHYNPHEMCHVCRRKYEAEAR